ncbi:lysozyme inhibitor LprI family protein [Pukyongiella litopenaei]|uniref:DUF1311 domain-containing protein n=1 Tax=Pukyongiella litopenaei TaxID=2605946 RepID=A0A5C2H3W7_9RHOB|nr:lysozyme inhibitor LprI family protein [Pukyongiella litopenaei]QEP30335.1 DUF1311 domain-containing protein [Pukyongiella litopenaei]
MRQYIATLLCLAAPLAWADEGPSFDCAKAQSGAEQLVCEDAGLAELDRRLAGRFTDAVGLAQGLDAGAEEAVTELKAMQRGWIKGRDECWKAADQRACVADAYLRREARLVAFWLMQEPTGTEFWACGGNPSNEVVTMFFDTELPGIRFERGDSIDTGVLSPSETGTRYEGDFGRSIWIRDDEATYREPDPDGTEYDCVLTQRD